MKIVVQRASHASCTVDHKVISEIQMGYVLLVGFTHTDTSEDVAHLAKKVANLRIFEDEDGKLNKSILDVNGEILSISQFTLYGNAQKGNRPSFTMAMDAHKANLLYQEFNKLLEETYQITTKTGAFGQMMDISFTNNGPVTIILER